MVDLVDPEAASVPTARADRHPPQEIATAQRKTKTVSTWQY